MKLVKLITIIATVSVLTHALVHNDSSVIKSNKEILN